MHGIFLFVFVHQASASWMSALLIQHLKTIILKQMWRAKFLRHCAPVAASAGLTIGNATPIFCVGDAEPKRIEAKIYADWRHTFPWLELTDKGIGCKSCMALTEGAKAFYYYARHGTLLHTRTCPWPYSSRGHGRSCPRRSCPRRSCPRRSCPRRSCPWPLFAAMAPKPSKLSDVLNAKHQAKHKAKAVVKPGRSVSIHHGHQC